MLAGKTKTLLTMVEIVLIGYTIMPRVWMEDNPRFPGLGTIRVQCGLPIVQRIRGDDVVYGTVTVVTTLGVWYYKMEADDSIKLKGWSWKDLGGRKWWETWDRNNQDRWKTKD